MKKQTKISQAMADEAYSKGLEACRIAKGDKMVAANPYASGRERAIWQAAWNSVAGTF